MIHCLQIDLYFKISKHAIQMAEKLKEIVRDCGLEFYLESPTNQQFVVLENEKLKKLKEKLQLVFGKNMTIRIL